MPMPDPDLRSDARSDVAERDSANQPDHRLAGPTAGVLADIDPDGAGTSRGGTAVTWRGTTFPLLTQPDPPRHS